MTIVNGPYCAMVEEVTWPVITIAYFQVAVACNGRIIYYQLEDTFQEAWHVAVAYLAWKQKQDNVAAVSACHSGILKVGQRRNTN